MRKLTAALLTGLLALTVVGTAVPAATADPASPTPQLRRDGRFMVDEHGRIVVVHGLNFVWKKAPYAPPNTAAGFTAADADWLYAHGFNGARIGMLWAGVTPNAPGVADPSYFAKWDRVIDLMAAKHMWIQFDQHQDMWHETYGGEGVPGWAAKRPPLFALLPYVKVPFPMGYWTPEVSTVFDNFWANKDGVQDGWIAYWKLVAQRYKNQPYSMGYDLMNEPWAGLEGLLCIVGGCATTYSDELQPAMTRAMKAVRQVDPQNIVWWEPQQFSAGTMVPTYYQHVDGEANLGLSWHNYCTAVFLQSTGIPLVPTSSCRGFTTDRENNALQQADTMGAVPLMSEWGATDNIEALSIDADVADEKQMGWMYWAYKRWDDPTTADTAQGLFTNDADLSSTKNDKLRQLVRTYPQATAGTDLTYDYDPVTGKFTMSFHADPSIDAPTRIFVSPLTAPHGYDVATTEGTVTQDGSYVDLAVHTDTVVHVTITPRP